MTPLLGLECLGVAEELIANPRWAPWVAIWNAKRLKWDKVPRQTDNPACGLSSAKPEQWSTFEAALAAYCDDPLTLQGLGYCMTDPHGIVGVDLDNCVDDAGHPLPWAAEVIAELNSYTERSPSGKGFRIMCAAAIEQDWTNNERGIEVYGGHAARFLTITGQHLAGTPTSVCSPSAEIFARLFARYAKPRKTTADVIDIAMPALLDEGSLPALAELPVDGAVRDFLQYGQMQGDRSGMLHRAGIGLFAQGLNEQVVFSFLASNPHAMTVALDHRRQDPDRAMLYLWREHVLKAKGKALASVASIDDFDLLENPKPTTSSDVAMPRFQRDKNGGIEATIENVVLACECPSVCGWTVRHDKFRDEILCTPGAGSCAWRPFGDKDYVELRIVLERGGFKPIGREMVRDAVMAVASRQSFDAAQEWLNRLVWDGVPRVQQFLERYLGVEPSQYAVGVSEYLWTALAGRVLDPGCKADMVPVLVGAQGILKTQSVAALSPSPDFFNEVSFAEDDKELARKMRGCLVAEIAELRGLAGKEAEAIKAFLSRTHETWVPKFREFAVRFPRRLVFLGTANTDRFLVDSTGNRRWLPFRPGVTGPIALAAIERDRDQLWAEGAALFTVEGVKWQVAEREAEAVSEEFTEHDAWEDTVREWLRTPDDISGERPADRKWLRTTDVFSEVLQIELKNVRRAEEMRLGAIFRRLGLERKKVRDGTLLFWGWFLPKDQVGTG